MNENLNLVEILKDCPKGTKLYSPIFGEVELDYVDNTSDYPINVKIKDGIPQNFTLHGELCNGYGGECTLFPSRSQRDWSRFKKKLKFNSSQSYFIFKNSGETMKLNNASSRKIKRKMKREGTKYLGEYHFVFPYNIHFEFPSDFIKEAIYEDKKLLDVMMYNLEHNIVHDIKSNIIYNIGAFFVSIQSIGGNINSFFYKVDSKKCVNCSACVNMCPVNNIVNKEGKIRFKHSCVMCMRCSFYCPKNAIDIGFLQGWKVTSYYSLDKY